LLLVSVSGCATLFGGGGDKQLSSSQMSYTDARNDCLMQTDKRLGAFDKPDTYPMSDDEKKNARVSLYAQCMQSKGINVGTPKPVEVASENPKDLAALSPAAGAPASGGTVILMGDGKPQTVPTGASTVVVVQSPQPTIIPTYGYGAQPYAAAPAPAN